MAPAGDGGARQAASSARPPPRTSSPPARAGARHAGDAHDRQRGGACLMAGTMPHAIFIEPEADGPGTFAAYAAELPGCAVFATSDDDAAARMPQRVTEFTGWLRDRGEPVPAFVGDNWYEVERAAATSDGVDGRQRAAFSLDELSPSDDEFGRWMRWLELAREDLADALDVADETLAGHEAAMTAIVKI